MIATGNASLFCLSRQWMPVTEVPLRHTTDKCEAVSISWEADGSRFVTRTAFATGETQVALWSRECVQLSVCEEAEQLHWPGANVNFRPTGFLVAVPAGETVRLYESNGLLKDSIEVAAREVAWSSDASLMAVVTTTQQQQLQVWRQANYQWQLCFSETAPAGTRLVGWGGPRQLLCGDEEGRLLCRRWVMDSQCSALRSQGPDEWAWVHTVVGRELRLCCIRERVVPPPMAQTTLQLPWVPVSASVAGNRQQQPREIDLSSRLLDDLFEFSLKGDFWAEVQSRAGKATPRREPNLWPLAR